MTEINDENKGLDKEAVEEHEKSTKVKTIEYIQIGDYRIETWYYSPFPSDYNYRECLYFCSFCLTYFQLEEELTYHIGHCKFFYPPGDEIYRDDKVSIFEVDGYKAPTYCENLCLISKLFLDHKVTDNECTSFLFYIICERSDEGCYMVGYFSKEKMSENGFNLSCIMILPPFQRNGYGKLLIDFSYLLSRTEEKLGSPETPLSDLGFSTYFAYWLRVLIEAMQICKKEVSIKRLSTVTGIHADYVESTLKLAGLLRIKNKEQYLVTDLEILNYLRENFARDFKRAEKRRLLWVPYPDESGF